MGILDSVKKLAKGRSKQIESAIEKVGDAVDKKTGGKHGDQIDDAVEKAKDVVEGLDPEAGKA